MAVTTSGRNSAPARSGEAPVTSCRNSELSNCMPTRIPVAASMVSMPVVRVRDRSVPGGRSGAAARRSASQNPASSTADTPSDTSVRADPQPCAGAPLIA